MRQVELPCGVGGVELSPEVPASPTSLPDPEPLPDADPEPPPDPLPEPEVSSPEELLPDPPLSAPADGSPLCPPDPEDVESCPFPSDVEPQFSVAIPVTAQAATRRQENSHRSRDMAKPFRRPGVWDVLKG